MAKKSRSRNSSYNFLSAPFIAGILVVVGIVAFLYFGINGGSVKGTSTFQPPSGINHPIPVGSGNGANCSARVTAFSVSGTCSTTNSSVGTESRDRFSTASYTCADGTTGTITTCTSISEAFSKANMACAKAAGCTLPSMMPKPSATANGIFKPNTSGTNQGQGSQGQQGQNSFHF